MTSLRCMLAALLLFVVPIDNPAIARARQSTATNGDVRVYYCQNLALVTVRVFPSRVEVIMGNRTATLTDMRPASGVQSPAPVVQGPGSVEPAAQYSDGSTTLSGLGELVRLEEPGAVYWCRIEPAEAPWQEARFRGIDFRAAGDPAWSVEVDNEIAVEFAAGEGSARVVTKFPAAPLITKGTRSTLTTSSGSHTLAILAEQRACHYSGSAMTMSVTATLDGKTYTGCGRILAALRK